MTIDERIERLTQSVELLASIHKDNEARAEKRDQRLARLQEAMMTGIYAYLQELNKPDGGNVEGEK
jgi:hypothetical protein